MEERNAIYGAEAREMLDKVRKELSEDVLLDAMESNYDVTQLLEFNEFNVGKVLELNAFHMKDFRLKFLQESNKYEQVKDHLDKIVGEKYKALKEGAVTLTKTEIEKYYLPQDEEIMKLKALLRKQEVRMKYFEIIWEVLDKLGWNIKLYLDNGKHGY